MVDCEKLRINELCFFVGFIICYILLWQENVVLSWVVGCSVVRRILGHQDVQVSSAIKETVMHQLLQNSTDNLSFGIRSA